MKMQDTSPEDTQWVVDFIVQFLRSPAWIAPVMTFVDNHCSIFDNDDENKFSYTECHNKFKKLVDDLLTDHLADLGVTPEQFGRICVNGVKDERFHKILVQQLLAVDDFLCFKKMMVKRNLQLELEARNAIEGGGSPRPTSGKKKKKKGKDKDGEEGDGQPRDLLVCSLDGYLEILCIFFPWILILAVCAFSFSAAAFFFTLAEKFGGSVRHGVP
uniref:Cilia- and flagella-associated protein 36 n=1 Tax=Chromera velia CCMP2878 TaxID=1169474 RepID=A0A0G4HZU2_9ALVE|eukprot:Cvel_9808.t1-p1 / transcript=Cvel_9808.t1 / gene=Cvel_9808 / organism=Chromera_velia_CCMP2878 / gene_product=Coiled-coil domain-containing protein 104, putative / transcript_product=Coiled-coil domain-containing protein 104, putative / location=Cvel_scaffold575:74888-76626(-) / protein_length=214 / sequence_SO=supercontig / SO=protein_coding / is_pseudo=false